MIERVLVTGADGNIGKCLRMGLRGHYPVLRLSHRRPFGEPEAGEEIVLANLDNFDEVSTMMDGVDAVVHMGGKGNEGDWHTVVQANVIGTINLFEAARIHKVRRVVLASTNHVVGYYRRDRMVGPEDSPRPDSRYATTKVFSEAVARLYADKYGLSVICQRIGCFRTEPADVRMLSEWVSPRDMVQLTRRCIDAPDIHFEVVYGVSNNTRTWWHNPVAEKIGYRPEDNAEDYADKILSHDNPRENEVEVACDFQGGKYAALEFSGDPGEIV
jgi:uronate dehydrogenase